jgi:hypothetical protein
MFAALIFGVLAIYFIIGFIIIAALDRSVARRRTGGALWAAVIFWPVTVIVDLVERATGARQ